MFFRYVCDFILGIVEFAAFDCRIKFLGYWLKPSQWKKITVNQSTQTIDGLVIYLDSNIPAIEYVDDLLYSFRTLHVFNESGDCKK